jgi:uncharacterized protein YkwD
MFRRTILVFLLPLLLLTLSACGIAQAALPTETATPPSDYTIYIVKPGETLSQLALHFHVTVEQLIALNADQYPALARDPSVLQPGWRLRVPGPQASAAARATAEAAQRADLNQVGKQIVEGINAARAQRGLLLLRSDVALTQIASDRSTDMVARNYFSHYDPQTGQQPLLRYLQATNFSYHYAGENIAEIKNDAGWVPPWLTVASRYSATELANEFVRGWLNSAEHRVNIYGSSYRRTGVALAVSNDGRRVVATQVFSD